VRRAADHLPDLAARLLPRVVYTDLDGTLLGPGGSLFASPNGGVTGRAAEAVAAVHRAGIALVPTSGRVEATVREASRLLGADGYIAELGAITVRDGDVIRAHGAHRGTESPYRAMLRSGAAGLLLEANPRRLELYTPSSHHRECSLLLRGHLDVDRAVALLQESGYGWVTVEDNGIVPRRYPTLDVDEVHVYHLVPRGVSKAAAVAADMVARGVDAGKAVAVGDSPTDVALAPHVGAVFVVANGVAAVGDVDSENVYVTDEPNGDGFAQAILGLLTVP
jgi:hydroxymethylpyrimidine pyrophosphatase-like HAD family hydrolase